MPSEVDAPIDSAIAYAVYNVRQHGRGPVLL